jgi:hypothetical protein|tara:strand:- start:1171 stop:1581 length:411 start_codon:yes stop_codon:yes gene_type:complete
MTIGKNMLIVSSSFRGAKSFNLVPATPESPYVEAMYDPSSGILAVISKVMKQSYHMIPKLDDNGDPLRVKGTPREGGKTVREERRLVDTFSEFYLTDKQEISDFINIFAVNAESFDFSQYMVDVEATEKSPIITMG